MHAQEEINYYEIRAIKELLIAKDVFKKAEIELVSQS